MGLWVLCQGTKPPQGDELAARDAENIISPRLALTFLLVCSHEDQPWTTSRGPSHPPQPPPRRFLCLFAVIKPPLEQREGRVKDSSSHPQLQTVLAPASTSETSQLLRNIPTHHSVGGMAMSIVIPQLETQAETHPNHNPTCWELLPPSCCPPNHQWRSWSHQQHQQGWASLKQLLR